MIYNRTYIDIINARKIFANKIQKFIELTEDEQNIVDRAYFNLTAINRITAKLNEMWQKIVNYGGVKVENEDVREWTDQEMFTIANFANIRENIADAIEQLANLNFVDVVSFQNAYNILNDGYVYTNLNNLEKLLFDIYNVFDRFVIQVGDDFYLLGAYSVIENEGELTIE